MWSYDEAMDYLAGSLLDGKKHGLLSMRMLWAYFANPDHGLRFIHIAGTNGKGSTAAAIAGLTAGLGLKVGLYTSPYIENFTERIRIITAENLPLWQEDRRVGEIAEADVARLLAEIKKAIEHIKNDVELAIGEEWHPHYFEILTTMAVLYYAEQGCDLVVWETGMGGEFDSTNVIKAADITIITALNYDHCEYLGRTLPEIAATKSKIIKPDTIVLLYDINLACPENRQEAEQAKAVIAARGKTQNVPILILGKENGRRLAMDISGGAVELTGIPEFLNETLPADLDMTTVATADTANAVTTVAKLGAMVEKPNFNKIIEEAGQFLTSTTWHYPLLGNHQQYNMQMAIWATVLFSLRHKESIDLDLSALQTALTKIYWPARLEVLQSDPPVLLDGAHNKQGARALGITIKELMPATNPVIICGFVKEKNHKEMMRIFLEHAEIKPQTIICLTPDAKNRAVDAQNLAQDLSSLAWQCRPTIIALDGVAEALKYWREHSASSPLLIFGSLYLAGTCKTVWKKYCRNELIAPDGNVKR